MKTTIELKKIIIISKMYYDGCIYRFLKFDKSHQNIFNILDIENKFVFVKNKEYFAVSKTNIHKGAFEHYKNCRITLILLSIYIQFYKKVLIKISSFKLFILFIYTVPNVRKKLLKSNYL